MTAIEFALGLRRVCRKQFRLTDMQLDVLLARGGGVRTTKAIADYYEMHGAQITRAMHELVRAGLVYQSADQPWPIYSLLPEGRAMLQNIFSFIES